MTEKFSFAKLVKSPFSGIYWVKTTMFSGGFLVFLLIGYMIYHTFFKRVDTNSVVAQEGSIVNIVGDRKKTFIPFVEGFVEKNANTDQEFNTGIRAGLRFEF